MFDKDEYREVRGYGFQFLGLAAGWWLAITLFFVAVGGIWWGITVATAPVVGKGEQHIQLQSAENRTHQYQHFFDLDATIRSQVRNAAKATQALADFNKTTPPQAGESFSVTETRNQLRANVTGLEQLCQTNVAQYN